MLTGNMKKDIYAILDREWQTLGEILQHFVSEVEQLKGEYEPAFTYLKAHYTSGYEISRQLRRLVNEDLADSANLGPSQFHGKPVMGYRRTDPGDDLGKDIYPLPSSSNTTIGLRLVA